MSTLFNSIKNILIIVLLLVVAGMFIFRPSPEEPDYSNYIEIGGEEYIKLAEQRDTVWETKTVTVPEYVPVPGKTEYVEKVVEVPADVDTAQILQDYYAERTYNDTIPIDTVGNAYITDVISENRIMSRNASFDYKLPTIENTTFVKELPKRQVFFGGGLGVDKTNIVNNVNTGLLYKTKDDRIFGAHFGISNSDLYRPELQTTENDYIFFVEASMYWPIRFGNR